MQKKVATGEVSTDLMEKTMETGKNRKSPLRDDSKQVLPAVLAASSSQGMISAVERHPSCYLPQIYQSFPNSPKKSPRVSVSASGDSLFYIILTLIKAKHVFSFISNFIFRL